MIVDGPAFLLTFWGLNEVILASLGLAQIIIYIQRMIVDTEKQEEYMDNMNGYVSFIKGVNLAYDWFNITAVMVFIMTVWVSSFLVAPPQRAERLIWSLQRMYGCCMVGWLLVVTYEILKISSSDFNNFKLRMHFRPY